MKIGFDPAKNAKNIRERGLSFEDAATLDWRAALLQEDDRKAYGERRLIALLPDRLGRLHVVGFTMRPGAVFWVFSFRKANKREGKLYHEKASH